MYSTVTPVTRRPARTIILPRAGCAHRDNPLTGERTVPVFVHDKDLACRNAAHEDS